MYNDSDRDHTRGHGGALLLRSAALARKQRARTGIRISGLASSDAPDTLTQGQVLERLGLADDEFAQRIFGRCGVTTRHLELSDAFLDLPLQARTAQVEHELLEHSTRAIDALGVDPSTIGTVFSASLYSLGVPTLAHRLIEHYDMDPTTDKYHITGVGCASGVPLMRLAAQTLHEHPDKHTLVVAAESMSGLLMRGAPEDPRAKTVGSSIFGDGCAAALLSHPDGAGGGDEPGPAILASQVHQVGDSLGAVALSMSGEDSYLHLARELPDIAGEHLREVVERFLRAQRMSLADVDHWVVHPGGRRIIENVQTALSLSNEDVATSWDALAAHGNIGTPSIMYVLKDTIERYAPGPGERGMLVTIGPGVTAGLMLLGW